MRITHEGVCIPSGQADNPKKSALQNRGIYVISLIAVQPYGRESPDLKLFIVVCRCGRLCESMGFGRPVFAECCWCRDIEMEFTGSFMYFCKICEARAKKEREAQK